MYFDYFDQIQISTDYNLSIFIFTAHFSYCMQQTDIASNQQYRKTPCPVPPLNDHNFVKFMRGTGQGV